MDLTINQAVTSSAATHFQKYSKIFDTRPLQWWTLQTIISAAPWQTKGRSGHDFQMIMYCNKIIKLWSHCWQTQSVKLPSQTGHSNSRVALVIFKPISRVIHLVAMTFIKTVSGWKRPFLRKRRTPKIRQLLFVLRSRRTRKHVQLNQYQWG